MALLVPEFINGRPTYVSYAGDIPRLLQEGDPTIGWEGDERLYLVNHGQGKWAVGRLCEDGSRQLVLAGEGRIDKSILIRLRDHDSRKVDVIGMLEKRQIREADNRDQKMKERLLEPYEKVVWALNRDVGHKY